MQNSELPPTALLKINLGCGWDKREGFVNVDLFPFHEPDLVADICNLAPHFDEGSVDEALAQDVLEHIPREKAKAALAEWARVLRHGGTLTVRVPSLKHMLQLFDHMENSLESDQQIEQLFYGTQAYGGDFHQCGFTPRIMTAWGHDAGLQVVSAEVIDTWMLEVRFRKIAVVELGDEEYVQNVYFTKAMRPGDQGGIDFFSEQLKAGLLSRDEVSRQISANG